MEEVRGKGEGRGEGSEGKEGGRGEGRGGRKEGRTWDPGLEEQQPGMD